MNLNISVDVVIFFCYTGEVGEKDASAGNLMGNFNLLTRYSHAC